MASAERRPRRAPEEGPQHGNGRPDREPRQRRRYRSRASPPGRSEDVFRTLVESASEPIVVLQDRRIRYVNPKACEVVGHGRDALLERAFDEFLHPEDRASFVELHRGRRPGDERLRVGPCRILTQGGEARWFEVNSTRISWAGRPATLVTLPEITRRVQAEEALRRSEEQVRQVVQEANNIILRRDVQGRITFLNGFAQRFFGYREEEVRGRPIVGTLLPERDARGHLLAGRIEELLRNPEGSLTHETESLRRNGERVWIVWTDKAVRGPDGEVAEVLSIGTDLTEQRCLEEQLQHAQKMEAFGRLAAGIAHDFNNLLTAINGYSEMILMDGPEEPAVQHRAEQIKLAGERAAALTQQLLAIGRKQRLQPRELEINEEVTRMHDVLQRVIGEDVELVVGLAPDLGTVVADPERIGQVLLNLVVNARDAMTHGGRLSVETEAVVLDEEAGRRAGDLPPGRYVLLTVGDTGTGMAPDILKRIFEPFFTTKGERRGTGLGLSTVYGIVKQSGGAVRVESEPGVGSRFHVYLPCGSRPAEPPALPPSVLAVAPAAPGEETVLLVEDDAGTRHMLQEVLVRHGFAVLPAQNAFEALEISTAHAAPIHLLVTDVVMPRMSGCELVRNLGVQRPGMKVLYMSGYGRDATAHHGAVEAGAAFIEKPFSASYLVNRVRDVLRNPCRPVS